MRDIDKFRGCLLGGAAGDALGYAVEFRTLAQIRNEYGGGGITEYALSGGLARFSDDTQMTLFTAAGLLCGEAGGKKDYRRGISECYLDWYRTQTEPYRPDAGGVSWLMEVSGLFIPRAPGGTCLSSCAKGADGSVEAPINDRRGCGGVMRAAPVGLYFAGAEADPAAILRLGAECAALTHGHPLAYLPAAILAHAVHSLASSPDRGVAEALENAAAAAEAAFPASKYTAAMSGLMRRALELAASDTEDEKAIRSLGEGWVGDEAMAIAAYCAAKYPEDFDRAMIASVNHSGDSDSTGAICGNILGAHLGLAGIPEKYLARLELREVILAVADDLYHGPEGVETGRYRPVP